MISTVFNMLIVIIIICAILIVVGFTVVVLHKFREIINGYEDK